MLSYSFCQPNLTIYFKSSNFKSYKSDKKLILSIVNNRLSVVIMAFWQNTKWSLGTYQNYST